MSLRRHLPAAFDDESWRLALRWGLLSVPFTAYGYWQSGDLLDLTPVLVAALLAGYFLDAGLDGDRVGARVGLVGALPVLWMVADGVTAVLSIANPVWFTVALVGVVGGVASLGVCLSVFTGLVGSKLGRWLAGRTGRRRPATESPAANG